MTSLARLFEQASLAAPVGQIILAADERVLLWNDWIASVSQIPAERALGAPYKEVFGGLLPPRLCRTIEECLRSGMSSVLSRTFTPHPFPLSNQQFKDSPMWQSVSVGPVVDADGNRCCVINILDVSNEVQREGVLKQQREELDRLAGELRKANDELQIKNDGLSRFTAMASHDLREPVRKLVSFTALLEEDLGDGLSDAAREDLGFIVDAAHRMNTMITALLSLARADHSSVDFETIGLDACVDDAVDALSPALAASGGEVTRDPLPQACVDRALVTQLYQNLIGNSIKFIEGPPAIRATCEQDGDEVVFGVRDNGIGFDEQHAEDIFAPFRRLHGRSEFPGCGIGLSICRKVVERHGGRIWVESQPGHGAHFRFTLAAGPATRSAAG